VYYFIQLPLISTRSATQLNLENKEIETNYRIKLPNDSRVKCPISNNLVPITIGEIVFPGVLIQFDSSDFDIILEMSWLFTYKVKIDFEKLKVISRDERGREIYFMGKKRKTVVL